MLNKLKIIGAVILLLLGFGLAVGYPNGGVKKVVKYYQINKNDIPTLNKKGNEKNFLSNRKFVRKPVENTIKKNSHSKSSIKKSITSNANNIINTKLSKVVKSKPKTVTPKPVKKRIKLFTPPPPAEEEEEDEGC